MIRFECDYGEGAAQPVLDLLQKTNLDNKLQLAITASEAKLVVELNEK